MLSYSRLMICFGEDAKFSRACVSTLKLGSQMPRTSQTLVKLFQSNEVWNVLWMKDLDN